jgi:hypothetical protein
MESKELRELREFLEGLTPEEAEVLLKAAKKALPQVEARKKEQERESTRRYIAGMVTELGRKMPEIVTEYVVDCFGARARAARNREGIFELVDIQFKG